MHGDVFLLWHVHHAANDEGQVEHLDESGELRVEEEFGDNVKLLGVYSSDMAARARIDSAKGLPGFSNEPDCFIVGRYTIDDDEWMQGFNTVRRDS
ncbi:hypothetical protein [Micromonospora parva]|uniref:hypothetical protein n=1 Tax=Micromonospora parva TaxID=1464048 RepID=UPI0033CE5E53